VVYSPCIWLILYTSDFKSVLAFAYIRCRQGVVYGKSKSGKVWKRRAQKRNIPCPLCPASSQCISRHLRHCHKLSSAEASIALASTSSYRQRGSGSQQPRVQCPVIGCGVSVVRLSSHLKLKHKQTDFRRTVQCRNVDVSDISTLSDDEDDVIPPSPNAASTVAKVVCPVQDNATKRSEECLIPDTSAVAALVTHSVSSNQRMTINQIVDAFERHMASIDGGLKAQPINYSLAVKQILTRVGGQIDNLTKQAVNSQYVQPMMSHCPTLSQNTSQ